MADNNSFLVPLELGWDCNDKLSDMLLGYAVEATNICTIDGKSTSVGMMLKVVTAEYIDNIYAVIKEYQEKSNDQT